MLHFQSFSLVGFLQEFVPAPADLITAKYCQQDRTYGHDIVGHQEIPEVQPGRSRRKGLKMDHAEAQRRCQCQQKRSHTADDTSYRSRPSGQFPDHGQNIFTHAQHCGHGCEHHEQEK